MALMPPACVLQAGGLAADAAQVWPAVSCNIALNGHAGVLAAEQADGGGCDERGCDRRVKVHQGFGKLFDGGGLGCGPWLLASCPLTLLLCLPWACAHGIRYGIAPLGGHRSRAGLGRLVVVRFGSRLGPVAGRL